MARLSALNKKVATDVHHTSALDGDLNLEYDMSALSTRAWKSAQLMSKNASVAVKVDIMLDALSTALLSWDLTDDNDRVLPINRDTLEGLSVNLLMEISAAIGAANTEKKDSKPESSKSGSSARKGQTRRSGRSQSTKPAPSSVPALPGS